MPLDVVNISLWLIKSNQRGLTTVKTNKHLEKKRENWKDMKR